MGWGAGGNPQVLTDDGIDALQPKTTSSSPLAEQVGTTGNGISVKGVKNKLVENLGFG